MSIQNQKKSLQKRLFQIATITMSLSIGGSFAPLAYAQINPNPRPSTPTRPVNPAPIRPITPSRPEQQITQVELDTENEAVQNLLLEAVRSGDIEVALINWAERAELSDEEIRALRQLDEVDLKILGENIDKAEGDLAKISIKITIRLRRVTIEICIGCD
ncbi:hypothetical protein AA637_06960 [Cyanobacterium sp. HL-69]|uniref:hypothetical protein n=1 Tax=Cyanobacterium sp. HL-69 TaxID=2054282 RepID=UPI000CA3AB77|nr:hypothetical protein AA637_06960 [Cyanobacterium sp. HL-69]